MKSIIKKIAKTNGVTPEEVKNEMQEAVRLAMQSNDPKAKAFWSRIAPDNKQPSVERVIKYISSQIQK